MGIPARAAVLAGPWSSLGGAYGRPDWGVGDEGLGSTALGQRPEIGRPAARCVPWASMV